jgi:hypothetical protein
MGLFSRNKASTSKSVLPEAITLHLSEYARETLRRRGGAHMDSRFGWDYVGSVINGVGGPDREAIIAQLWDAGSNATDPLITIGAYELLNEGASPEQDERFLALRDSTLDYLHDHKYSSGYLSRDEADRWIVTHGDLRTSFDGIVERAIPSPASLPALPELAVGESQLLALTAPLPDGNAFYAERRDESTYVIYSERNRSDDDPTRQRYDEDYLGAFSSLQALCITFGEHFGIRPWWTDDWVDPYFPFQRS